MASRPRHRHRSRAQWQSLIERARRTSLSVTAFCQAEGISTASLYAWRKRITGSAPQPAAVPDCAATPSGPSTGVVAPLSAEAASFLDLGTLAGGRCEAAHWELALGGGVVLRLRRI